MPSESVFPIMVCGFAHYAHKTEIFFPHFFGFFHQRYTDKKSTESISVRIVFQFVYQGAQLSLRKDASSKASFE